MDLGGLWRAVAANEGLRRTFSDPDLDDAGWSEITVPHHWRSHPDFANSDGPLLYRRRFPSAGEAAARSWLRFEGLFYQGDVWLDGSYLGDTEGYFFPHVFEVTAPLARGGDHLLALELTCDRPGDRRAKRYLTGAFQDSDTIAADWNPGGIWRPVTISHTGPVRLARLRLRCDEATEQRARVELAITLGALHAGLVTVETVLTGPSGSDLRHTFEHPVAAGSNEVHWRIPVERPALWWPHALGDQPQYDVTVTVSSDGVESDRRQLRTGIRQVRFRDFVATINGERLFLKGANVGPARRELGEATAEGIEADVAWAREAGLDLLRVHGHISRPELYDAADRLGVLLWQDLPMEGGYAGVRRAAVRQAVEAVDLLGHHPSVMLWCGRDEHPLPSANGGSGRVGLARQLLPTWDRSVLDRSVHRALEHADHSRPVVAHSGVLPHPAWGTDTHLFLGWLQGDGRDLPELLARFPVLSRFVSEFGAQAVPDHLPWYPPPGTWPDVDWDWLAREFCLQKGPFDRYVAPDSSATFEEWRAATQAYQAELIRSHIETLRRLKYRPTGGFCHYLLADSQPAVSCAVLDDQRRPKPAWAALVRACAPVIVVADGPRAVYQPGEAISLALHVVSDLRTPIDEAEIRATWSWSGGTRAWRFAGGVAADSCARIGLLEMAAPAADGPIILDLDLTWSGGHATNQYVSRLVVPPGPKRSE